MLAYRAHIALMLFAVISLNILAVPISYLNFKIHQDYYATVLCENPDKPITVCGGICYLKKQLPQAEDTKAVSFVSSIDLSVYFHVYEAWSFPALATPSPVYRPYLVSFSSRYAPSAFHPPQV